MFGTACQKTWKWQFFPPPHDLFEGVYADVLSIVSAQALHKKNMKASFLALSHKGTLATGFLLAMLASPTEVGGAWVEVAPRIVTKLAPLLILEDIDPSSRNLEKQTASVFSSLFFRLCNWQLWR